MSSETSNHDTLSMSYLATICCGLAAATILFLIFAAAVGTGLRTASPAAAIPERPTIGAFIPDDDSHRGNQDVVAVSLDVDGDTADLSVAWDGVPSRVLSGGHTIQLAGTPHGRVIYCSPVWTQAQQAKPIYLRVFNPTATKQTLIGRVVVAAAGRIAPPIEVRVELDPGGDRQIGIVDLYRKSELPGRWFEPDPSIGGAP